MPVTGRLGRVAASPGLGSPAGGVGRRVPDRGLILLNVLLAVAVGAAMVTLMLASQSLGLDQARRAAASAQAEALARAGETSVAAALRRDLRDGPHVDSLSEPWALALRDPIKLPLGQVAVVVHDAQAGLDLNGLTGDGLVQADALRRLVALLGLPAQAADAVLASAARGPVERLDQVGGLTPEARARLEAHVTLLPAGTAPGGVNLNTASPLLIEALLGSRRAAERLVARRDRAGQVTRLDLLDLGVVPAAAVGFTSDVWDVAARAEVGGVTVILTSRLARRRAAGIGDVVPISRRFGAAATDPSPPRPPEPATSWDRW